MKYTPGPWVTNKYCVGLINGADGEVVASVYEKYRTKDEVLATTNLIKAAPDLLKALKEAITVLETRNPEWEQTLFRSIVAKAEGQTE